MGTFTTPFEQYADREGTEYEFLGWITEPTPHISAEVLPMAMIRFADGLETQAWPCEIEEDEPVLTEPGAASMIVDLSDGVITVTHGTDDVVLQRWVANRGDWDRIWETIYQLAGEEVK